MKKHLILQLIGLITILSVVLASPIAALIGHADNPEPEANPGRWIRIRSRFMRMMF
jgi:hypothetical protein